jgi:acyl dehydratase
VKLPSITELTVGQLIGEEHFEITRDSLVRYAGASGDFNPIHYRDDIAQQVGLPGVLAHGMLTMGVSISPVVEWLGDPGKVVDYSVRFTKPVLVPATGSASLTVSAVVGAIEDDRVRIDITTSFEGNNVLGKAQAWVKP